MLCDYHVHSTYCDGKSTLRENIESAVKLDMDVIGFSGHSCVEGSSYCMTREGTKDYIREISALKEEYRDRITVLCGLEKDYYSSDNEADFDYVIGSLHFISDGEKLIDIDHTPAITRGIIDDLYGGDELSYCEAYFGTLGKLFDKVKADIIGHFDLINKFAEKGIAFDTECPRYIRACTDALDSLLVHNVPFEINTGAMSRGHRTAPYPSKEALKYIKERGGSIILNSDSHDAKNLCYAFDIARELAKECGFKSRIVLTQNSKIEIDL